MTEDDDNESVSSCSHFYIKKTKLFIELTNIHMLYLVYLS